MSTKLFVEKMNDIYNPATNEDALYILLEEFVELFQERSFDVLYYVLRNSRGIYSENITNFALKLILLHKETIFYVDMYRLKYIGYNSDPPPTILKVYYKSEYIYDLKMKWWKLSFEEIKISFDAHKQKLNFDNVQIIRSEDEYDLSKHIIYYAEKLGYLK